MTQGTVTLTNDTLSGNIAQGASGGGGDSSSGNGGKGAGGGLYVTQGSVTLTNDTLSGNMAQGGSGGFAVYSSGNGGNGTSGGLYTTSGSTTILANSLIAANTVAAGTGGSSINGMAGSSGSASDPDVSGTVASSDHDLLGDPGDSSGFSTSNGDILNPTTVGLDPLGLQNNGGPTKTIALVSGSQAIDAGESNAPGLPSTDQRGYARIVGNAVDIGADESGATAAATDLSVTGNAPSFVAFGGQITYTLTVTNNSSSAQSNVTLTDELPANTTLASWTVPSDWSSSTATAAGSSSGTVTAWIASLAANASATFTLVVQVNSGTAVGTVISNSASVGPISGDPTPNNNSISFQTTTVQASA